MSTDLRPCAATVVVAIVRKAELTEARIFTYHMQMYSCELYPLFRALVISKVLVSDLILILVSNKQFEISINVKTRKRGNCECIAT